MARDTTDSDGLDHSYVLEILARADAQALKKLADSILPDMPDIEVLRNETGLVMLPMRDTVQGTAFHLGEVLVAHAHIQAAGQEGYGMRIGDDPEAAMAMAVLELAHETGISATVIADFIHHEAQRLGTEDTDRLRDIEATRVKMDTF